MPPRTRALVLAFFLLLLPAGRAATPLSYDVALAKTGLAALDAALHDSSTLISLRASSPVGPFGLMGRARNDKERLQTALESFGYYAGSITITIGGKALDDPALLPLLEAWPARPVPIAIAVVPGPLFRLGVVRIEGSVPAAARQAMALHAGEPARAADVLAAGDRLLKALEDAGYALAEVPPPVAFLHPATDTLDVVFKVDAGPRVSLGPIRIAGLKTVNESFVRRHLTIRSGERYSPKALGAARQKLAALPVFAAVSIEPAKAVDKQGTLPITVHLTERKLHVVSLDGSYSTDLGVSLGASWEDRNLFGNAEDLKLSASTNLGGTAIEGVGYTANAVFTKPDFLQPDQSLVVNLGTIDQNLYAYDQVALNAGLALSRPIAPHLHLSIGAAAERERITQNDLARHFTLLGLPITAAYDSTNSILQPTRGMRIHATLTPTASFGPASAAFVSAELGASTYLDLSELLNETAGRSILALRGLIGTTLGTNLSDLPGDKRFYMGGSGTVRGYRYLSIGPQFPNGRPTGGLAGSAATIELRQRFFKNWGAALFADAGEVATSANPFGGKLNFGAGGGLRYYTAVGPIRLDLAFPLTHENGGDRFELYVGLGEAF